ncbi:MAG: DUF4417 domain-containing protein [Chloroflexi bacterium]|nr:DUF4417 domain-containing protein [Chloroflexota bacterium]
MTQAHDWQIKPGNFDPLHSTRLFPSRHALGIPDLLHTPLAAVPEQLVAYRSRIRSPSFDYARSAVHFFLDDYRFETVWNRPERSLSYLRRFRILLTPDFSLYVDWPLAMQQWNVYRRRWCGRYWQELGFLVIPTVSWSSSESFDFCFAGLPRHSVLAVSTLGVDLTVPIQRERFQAGYNEMVARLAPTMVLSYGPLPAEANPLSDTRIYPSRWQKKRNLMSDRLP